MKYYLIDKYTAEVKGTASINDNKKEKWEVSFNLLPYDKAFKGLKHSELKVVNGKIKKKTNQEIQDYLDALPKEVSFLDSVREIVLKMKMDGEI